MTMLPIETPAANLTLICSLSKTLRIPMTANPLAPPPETARPIPGSRFWSERNSPGIEGGFMIILSAEIAVAEMANIT